MVYAISGCIWVLLPAAGHNHSRQTLEWPPATHLPKPLVMVLTAVKQGWISQREEVRPYGKKTISGSYTRIRLVYSSVDHVTWARRTPTSRKRAEQTHNCSLIKSMPHWNNSLPKFLGRQRINCLYLLDIKSQGSKISGISSDDETWGEDIRGGGE